MVHLEQRYLRLFEKQIIVQMGSKCFYVRGKLFLCKKKEKDRQNKRGK